MCVCVCVCVCVFVHLCVTDILFSLYATNYPLPTSSFFPFPSPFCPPSYTPFSTSPLLYAIALFCPLPFSYRWPVLYVLVYLPRSSHAKARAVISLPHPSALLADVSAPLCREGHKGSGCWISLSLVTPSTAQSHTFRSIPASACI